MKIPLQKNHVQDRFWKVSDVLLLALFLRHETKAIWRQDTMTRTWKRSNYDVFFFCMLTLFVRVERTVGRSISIFAVVALLLLLFPFFCCLYLMLIHSMLRAVLGSVSVLAFLLVLLLLFAALSPLAACGVALAPALGSQVAVALGVAHR